MSWNLLLAFLGFAVATSITPGPNNMMLLASGANFGFVRTVPHIVGITFGVVAMVLLIGLGLGRILDAAPLLYTLLRYAGAAYLLVLAWRLARSGSIRPGEATGRPMRFIEAALFQWVNPKAWVMVVGAVTTYAPHQGFVRNVLMIAVMLALINISCISVWAGSGIAVRRLLDRPARIRAFNICMAVLLVLSLYPDLSE